MVDISDIEFGGYQSPRMGPRRSHFITYVNFVIDDAVKVRGARIVLAGDPADPSRRLAFPSHPAFQHCGECTRKNLTAGGKYCSHCRAELPPLPDGQPLHYDCVYPINQPIRDAIEAVVFDAWDEFVANGHSYSPPEDLPSRVRQLLRSEA